MDIDLLKTFLELNRTRHFGRAADNLFLSQSAVSTRIRLLEERTGTPLFSRQRNAIHLTQAGERLLPHAEDIVARWNRARQELAIGDHLGISISIAATPSLWEILLAKQISEIIGAEPALALNVDITSPAALLRSLKEGIVDIGLGFDAPAIEGIEVEEIGTVALALVSSDADTTPAQALGSGYILVDWGTAFANRHSILYADQPVPRVRMALGHMARDLIIAKGGAAYLALPMVTSDLKAKRLHLVRDAERIVREIYLLRAIKHEQPELIERICAYFRDKI